jgi:YVTN family beta-propeller protein
VAAGAREPWAAPGWEGSSAVASRDADDAPRHAFATSEDAASVTAIDLTTRQAVATLPAGPVAHALALTPDGARLYVVNRRGGSLTVVDPRAPAVVATITLSADPMAAAVSPDGLWLAVLGRSELVAWVLEAATGALRYEIPLAAAPVPANAPPGPRSTHPVWSPDSASFYAEDNAHASLVRVDALRGVVAATVALPSLAHMAYVDAAGARVYALCVGAPASAGRDGRGVPPSVAVLDAAGDRLLADVPVPLAAGESGELHHATFDAAGRRLFVANLGQGRPRGGRSVHVLDTHALRLVARLEADAGAGHPVLSPDGTRLFVVNHSAPRLSVFDAERLVPVGEVGLPGARGMGHGCFFTADGGHFWAVSNTAGAAYAVDTATLAVVAQVPTGPNCQDIAHSWRDAYA